MQLVNVIQVKLLIGTTYTYYISYVISRAIYLNKFVNYNDVQEHFKFQLGVLPVTTIN